jgi:hypothetical protein
MAVAILVTGGVFATGTSAPAANPTVENVELLAGDCREVIVNSVNVYKKSTGTAKHGTWGEGIIFEYIDLVNGRYKTWWHNGQLAYVGSPGTKYRTCPW